MKNFFFALIIATVAFGIHDTATAFTTAEADLFTEAQTEFAEFYNNN